MAKFFKSSLLLRRIVEMLPEEDSFRLQWFVRKGKHNYFFAMKNPDGSPVLEVCSEESVMFWEMSENRREDSFSLSRKALKKQDHLFNLFDAEFYC